MQQSVLALDVGEKRIGVAIASPEVKIAHPLVTLANDESFLPNLTKLIGEHKVTKMVVGMPRNLSGDDTAQTDYTKKFVESLKGKLDVPVYTTDEAGTSKQARETLEKAKKPFEKADVDALAAAYILEDFLSSQPDHVQSGNK